jgi:hypothetical protein
MIKKSDTEHSNRTPETQAKTGQRAKCAPQVKPTREGGESTWKAEAEFPVGQQAGKLLRPIQHLRQLATNLEIVASSAERIASRLEDANVGCQPVSTAQAENTEAALLGLAAELSNQNAKLLFVAGMFQ